MKQTSSVCSAAMCLTLAAGVPAAWSQDAAPAGGSPAEVNAKAPEPKPRDGVLNRRVIEGPPTVLAFKGVTVDQLVPFIVEATGKVVLPQQDVLTRKVTLLNDEPIPRAKALDLVFMALQQIGVGVIENGDVIILRDINDIPKQDVPVVGPDETLQNRADLGTMVEKVFSLKNGSAENVGTMLKDSLPEYTKMLVDKESNQVVILSSVGFLQRIERLIDAIDRPSAAALQTETFRLRYADAEQIAQNIRDLFSADAARNAQQQGGRQNQQNPFQQFFRQQAEAGGGRGGGGAGQPAGGGAAAASSPNAAISANLRVSSNKQQNSVTVLAERQVLEQVRQQIQTHWDKPLPEEAVIPKVYDLKNSDPVKVRDLLEGLFGRGTTSTTGGGGGGASQASQGVGRLAGQFSFQAIPESSRLVVVSKSPDNLAVIDKIIEDLDQPQSAGLPTIIELKHANAEELAEQLNTLLAQDGTLAQIRRAESGLSESTSSASPFASDAATTTTGDTGTTTAAADNLSFWWSRSRPPTDRRGASNLIGTIRIVPVWRQNALMVLSPPEYRGAVGEMISLLDRPGRQVLISAVVAEVSSEDATALGLRWSSQVINPTNPDNSINIGGDFSSAINNALFDSSVLDVNADINVLLQALSEKTTVSVLSEPKIFTSDNQEAEFFDGQDIPFITDIQTNTVGNPVQSFDYRAVGIQLRVRPRITVNRDVDLRVNVELASLAPEQLNGAFVVDRRETTTQLVLKDGQTVVISGILRKEESNILRKVPLLGDIPLLGELFKSREKSMVDTELLIFITPLVVDNTTGSNDQERVIDPYRQRLEQLRERLDTREDRPDESTRPELIGG